MKKRKKSRNEISNLIFSAFLVTAFVVCSSFFMGMIDDRFSQDPAMRSLLMAVIFALFGGLLFYATRVGDGKQVFRFSPATLILMVLPALYVVIAATVGGLPFHEQLSANREIAYIAGAAFGYGLPYTFLSGYELDRSEAQSADGSDKTAGIGKAQTNNEKREDAADKSSVSAADKDNGVYAE